MFNVSVHRWAQYGTLHFKGHAALWLQTYEAQHGVDNSVDLCIAIESKFGKDLYHNSMQELLSIKQISNVQDYYDRFQTVMHKVLVHNNHLDDVFFVSKFIQGLHPDIRAAIVLHKPRTVDVALSLALMKADVLESQPKYFVKRNYRDYNKFPGKPPPAATPGVLGAPPAADTKPKWEDKLATLRAQWRAQGLCMKCGEKWGRNHKCPDKVALHVLEEFVELILDENPTEQNTSDSSDEDEVVFALSQSATVGVPGKKTIKLHGIVKDQELLILIDLGSTCTFISTKTATALNCVLMPAPPIQVAVANGDKLQSTHQVLNFSWWSQGHTFTTDARVLPLQYYDMVLGMDWLEQHSPMWIHWKR